MAALPTDPFGLLLPATIATRTITTQSSLHNDSEYTQFHDKSILNCTKVNLVELITNTLQNCSEVES